MGGVFVNLEVRRVYKGIDAGQLDTTLILEKGGGARGCGNEWGGGGLPTLQWCVLACLLILTAVPISTLALN